LRSWVILFFGTTIGTFWIILSGIRVVIEKVYPGSNNRPDSGSRHVVNQPCITVSHATSPRTLIARESVSATVVADIMVSADRVRGIYRLLVVSVFVEIGIVWRKMPTGPVRSTPPSVDWNFTGRVSVISRVSLHIVVEINSAVEANGIFANEPTCFGIVIPRPVEVEIGFGVELAARVLESVCE
jgi:hypothetical protein